MTQEEKDLLLKDLCSRLPYKVKFRYKYINNFFHEDYTTDVLKGVLPPYHIMHSTRDEDDYLKIEEDEVKPYLFPLSSMTEEQYNSLYESGILDNCSHSYEYVNPHIHGVSFIFKQFKTYSLELIEWLNKNHFDYRGLIEKGLAIDCTNLNIY